MSKENIIIGLDLGAGQVRTVVAQIQGDDSSPLVLGVGVVPSCGISNGVIVDIEDTINAINKSKEEAERIAGVPVEHAFVSINGKHISSQFSKGVVAVSRADGEISEEDVNRVMNAAQAISVPTNKEIINVFPCGYTVDGQEQIKSPVGMNGVRLEINALLIQGAAPFIKNIEKCVQQRCGIDIDDMIFAPIAAAKSVLSRKQRELGVVVIDIGKETTGIVVYEDGNMLGTAVIPVGAGHITNDIAIGLRTSIDVAEKIKLEYGNAMASEVDKQEEIDLQEIDSSEEGIFKRHYIAEIIEARVEEIFSMVDDELRKMDKSGMLPAGAVLVGGGAKMQGIVNLAKKILRLPSQIGYPAEMNGVVDRIDDPEFATAVGLVMWEADDNGLFYADRGGSVKLGNLGKKIKGIFKALLP
ncbi:MAG: cell division protein FtsA [Candidatus Pacebacteria bacterium]|nr:cell division protein FtsA [Candidatus Paceibacterota bacterium]